ncbi:MAG: maleylpyruvate isomerase family mycothiol-dependent enzyme [Ilumatobacter sp.]|nr:maleylpyruvate isomerase family mycothiol-dependent enzyme [Ilumatobacter sp.]
MTDGWTLAAKARTEYADMVAELTPRQLEQSTLCDGWTPHDVTAHLATFVEVPFPKFMFNVAKKKGDFDAAAVTMAKGLAERPTGDLVETLRAKAGKKASVPIFPGELTVTDVVVHEQDVRRGLDLPGAPDPELVQTALEFLTTNKRASLLLEKKGLLDGLRFEATDLDWSHGDGELVKGAGEALLLAMTRRDVYDELEGDGVATLKQRQRA